MRPDTRANLSFSHIGWAVKSIEKASEQLEALGFKRIEIAGGGHRA